MQRKQINWWQRPLALMTSLMLVVSSILMVVTPEQVQAATDTVYVSSGGDDANDGASESSPYATLQKAYQEVNDGGTIYLLDNITLYPASNDGKMLDFNLDKRVTITTADGVPTAVIQRGQPNNYINTLFGLTKGELTLKNITIDGKFNDQVINGRLFNVYGGSKLIIEDGAILQNSYSLHPGSAIHITTGSVVEMNGGEIRGNKRDSVGAAVAVDTGAEFYVTGGLIMENTGGGVQSRGTNGGVIYLSGDAQITENIDTIDSGKELNVNLEGNKTLILNGEFTGEAGITTSSMVPGTQFGQATEDSLGSIENLIADSGSLLVSLGENNALEWRLFKNELSQPSTEGEVIDARPTLKGVTEPNATVAIEIISAVDSSTVITKEVTADENGDWVLAVGETLKTGEYTINVTASKNKTQSELVIRSFEVEGHNVYVAREGSDSTGDGTPEHPYATLYKAYEVINDVGTIYVMDDIVLSPRANGKFLEVNNGKRITITTAPEVTNTAVIEREGSGTLFDLENGQLTLKNIVIDGKGISSVGRIVNIYNSSKLIIEEDAILRNNINTLTASAVYIRDANSVVIMTGGEISGNTHSPTTGEPTGAVYLNNGTFTMTGGSITGNSGGGVQVKAGNVHLSGDAIIVGNTLGESDRNVYLEGTNQLNLDGDFTGEAGITAAGRMTVGSQFGQAAADDLTGLENLFADNDTNLSAVYGEDKALIWHTSLAIPNNVKITGDSLTWDKVENADGYEVIITDSEGNKIPVSVTEGTELDLSALESPLAPGEYEVTVIAKSGDPAYTDSHESESVKYTVPGLAATPLDTPNNVQVTEDKLTWEPVDHADSYEVIITDSEGNKIPVSVTEGTELDLSALEPPLAPGEYEVTVIAKSNDPAYTDSDASVVTEYTVLNSSEVDKSSLQTKVTESNTLEESDYTPESWEQYQLALQEAQEVLGDPNATQEEVDAALEQLTAAQNALVQVAGNGLSSLTPSTGSLSPSFSSDVTNYTMNVGYATSQLSFTALPLDPNASVTMTVNGQVVNVDDSFPLSVGENTVMITVADSTGTKTYEVIINRAKKTSSGSSSGGSGGGNNKPPTTDTDTTTTIEVDLEIDGNNPLEKTTVEIERTKHTNGEITDFVALTEENAKEAVEKAKQIGNNIARIVIPDVNDEVDEVTVEMPKQSIQTLRDNGLSVEISTDNAHIAIPLSSMEGVNDTFYFRLVPVKNETERKAIEERARVEQVVRETLQSNDVNVVARPMTIETNMPSRPVQVTLPLKGVDLPTEKAEREEFLAKLAVFIEHSDGEKTVVFPEVVTVENGELGLRFTVDKFSTFSIIQFEKQTTGEHEAFIKGFEDGTFGPQKYVTRAQMARMIARVLGYKDGQTVDYAPFNDIPSDHYAAGAIAFVKERGIMNGDENGNFHAGDYITRAQMAAVVANYKHLQVDENVPLTFNDTKGHWAQWIIEANREAGIIIGREDGSFGPKENLTRAHAVKMLNRMFERGPLNGVTTPSFSDVKETHWAFKEIEEAARSHSYILDEDGNEYLYNKE